jgi:type II secretory pathway pseudopilin PulG
MDLRSIGKTRITWRLVRIIIAAVFLVTATVAVPLFREHSRYSEARAELAELSQQLDRFYLDNGFYPTTDEGLRALIGHDSSPDPGFVYPNPIPTRRGILSTAIRGALASSTRAMGTAIAWDRLVRAAI